MSEEGWRGFLAAEGLDDWVVLHGGATAVFRVGSVHEAARLAEAIAAVPGLDGSGAPLTIADGLLTVRLSRVSGSSRRTTSSLPGPCPWSPVIRRRRRPPSGPGGAARRSPRRPTPSTSGFWRAVLGYEPLADDAGADPLGHGSTVWMQELAAAKPLRHAMHVDVSVAREHAETRLAAALAAGGRVVDESTEHWTLADRAGNRVDITAWPDGATRSRPDDPAKPDRGE